MNQEQELLELEAKLKPMIPVLGKAADTILDENVSKYPIFILSQEEIAVGLPLMQNDPPQWSINASTLEEFSAKGLIEQDKVDDFRQVYKDPEKHICVLIANVSGATIVFLPRT